MRRARKLIVVVAAGVLAIGGVAASLYLTREQDHAPKADPKRQQVADEMREARAAARDKPQQALEHAKRAVELARGLGGRLLAEALLVHGEVGEKLLGHKDVEESFRSAATEAEAARADDVRALALARLAGAIAFQPGREQEALAMEPLVTAAIARANNRAYQPVLEHAMGIARLRMGEVEMSLARFKAALARAREVLPPDDPRIAEYLYLVSVALRMLSRDAEALPYEEEAFAAAQASDLASRTGVAAPARLGRSQ
jgi:tetratricopeptide (TPR) repeat protein